MPKVVYVKKARKDNPAAKAGEPYYWWKFNFGPKMYSATRPKRSQLTRSDFLATLWAIEDNIPFELTEDDADVLTGELEELLDECQNSLDNMPEQLQDSSDSGMVLQEHIDGLEDWIASIQSIDWESVTPEEAAEEVQGSNPGIG